LRAAPGLYHTLRFSPDGRRLALDILEGNNRDMWVYEWGATPFLVPMILALSFWRRPAAMASTFPPALRPATPHAYLHT